MRKYIFLLVLFSIFIACNRIQRNADDPKKETPKALQENRNDASSFSLSKRLDTDLLNDLYNGLVDENQPLKEIENLIDKNNTQKDDLLNNYNEFDNKNKNYYSSANSSVGTIMDSILKARVISVIKASSGKYNNRIINLEAIIKHIEAKSISIQDYHMAMKIILTLPLIEKYQQTHLPKDSIYKGFYNQQDQILTRINKIIKQ